MSNYSRFSILGLMAIVGSAAFLPGLVEGAWNVGKCDFITDCPTSQASVTADLETCMAAVPDYRDGVSVDLCNVEGSCYRVEQTPEPGTQVAIGDHEIRLSAIVCYDEPARGTNDNDNTMGNEPCMTADCVSIGECIVDLTVLEPTPQLQCPVEPLDPINLNLDCSVTVPDVLGNITWMACAEVEGFLVQQAPAAGETIFFPGSFISIRVFVEQLEQECFISVPVRPVGECPTDITLQADGEACTTTMPADLCDAYLPDCQELVRSEFGFYTCRTEPPAGATLGIGDTEVQLIIEECFFVQQGIGETGGDECIEIPELGCTLTVTVEGPTPTIKCPESEPELAPLQVSEDCTVVVPDLRGLVSVNACPGAEYELQQIPEPGSTYEISFDDFLFVYVYLEEKGATCFFYVPLNPIVECPDSPQVISYDENCEAVVPDLTGDVVYADCCNEFSEQPGRADFRCGEIRITQIPEAGTPLTEETEVSIIVERCFIFESETDLRGIQGEECSTLGSCVVILRPVDDTPPVIENCPDDLTIGADSDCLGVIPDLIVPDVTDLAIATDNCTPSDEIILTQSPAAGSEIGLGTTIVSLTATDAAGNSTTCSVTIELEENGCLNPPAPDPEPEPEPEPQPVPGCDPNNQSVNLLFSLLFHSPVCGATCPITVSMMFCGFLALRRSVRRRRR